MVVVAGTDEVEVEGVAAVVTGAEGAVTLPVVDVLDPTAEVGVPAVVGVVEEALSSGATTDVSGRSVTSAPAALTAT